MQITVGAKGSLCLPVTDLQGQELCAAPGRSGCPRQGGAGKHHCFSLREDDGSDSCCCPVISQTNRHSEFVGNTFVLEIGQSKMQL